MVNIIRDGDSKKGPKRNIIGQKYRNWNEECLWWVGQGQEKNLWFGGYHDRIFQKLSHQRERTLAEKQDRISKNCETTTNGIIYVQWEEQKEQKQGLKKYLN